MPVDDPLPPKGMREMPSNELPEQRLQSRSGRGRRWLMAPGCELADVPSNARIKSPPHCHAVAFAWRLGRCAFCRLPRRYQATAIAIEIASAGRSLSRSRRRFAMRRAERKQSARRGRPCIWPLITQTAIAGHCHRRYCFVGLATQRVAVASIGRQWDLGPSRALDRSCAPIYRSRGRQAASSVDLRKRNSTTQQRN